MSHQEVITIYKYIYSIYFEDENIFLLKYTNKKKWKFRIDRRDI